jgi:hypothetical protein
MPVCKGQRKWRNLSRSAKCWGLSDERPENKAYLISPKMPYRVLYKRFLEPPARRLQKSFIQNSVWHPSYKDSPFLPVHECGDLLARHDELQKEVRKTDQVIIFSDVEAALLVLIELRKMPEFLNPVLLLDRYLPLKDTHPILLIHFPTRKSSVQSYTALLLAQAPVNTNWLWR